MYRFLIISSLLIPSVAVADSGDAEPNGAEVAPEKKESEQQPKNSGKKTPKRVAQAPELDPGNEDVTPEERAAVAREAAQPATVARGDFMDVRLNLTFTNENVLVKPGETIPSVPGWRFGRPNSLGVLFFDNYDTRFSGYETLSHLVLYKRHDSGHYEVEGALVLRLNDLAEDRIDLSDAGTYLRFAYWFDETRRDPARISVTGFPTSSDRFRLGYSYRLSWGGSDEYRRSKQAVPGLKVQYDWDRGYAFVGAKSAIVLDRSSAEERSVLGGLAGAGYDVTDMLRVEVNGGIFDRGNNDLQDVVTEKVMLYGGSTQVSVHKGAPIGSSIDFALYRNDAERIQELFRQPVYEGGLTWQVAGEATVLAQTLKDPAVTGGTTTQVGWAADINARLKYNRTRLRFDLQARDVAFIRHPTPSLPTYSDFPSEYGKSPNLFAAVGGDHRLKDVPLTLGLVVGIDKPATLVTPAGALAGDTTEEMGETTVIIRDERTTSTLPAGHDVLPQFAVKGTSRFDFAENFAGIIDAYYTRDPNQSRFMREGPEDGEEGLLQRGWGEFNQLGFNITLQARF